MGGGDEKKLEVEKDFSLAFAYVFIKTLFFLSIQMMSDVDTAFVRSFARLLGRSVGYFAIVHVAHVLHFTSISFVMEILRSFFISPVH